MSTKLSRINWSSLANALQTNLPDLNFTASGANKDPKVANIQLITKDPDVMPQLQLLLGSRFTPVKNSDGQYSFSATAAEMVRKVEEGSVTWDGTINSSAISLGSLRGILMLMKVTPRGIIMPAGTTQSKGSGLNYCRFVPLILASWKKHKNIQYSEWDWNESPEDKRKLLDKDFVTYSEMFGKPELLDQFGQEELEEFRLKARMTLSTGQIKSPEATAIITKQTDPAFKALPDLFQFSLLQLWSACPHLWNSNMITNTLDLDKRPVSRFGEETSEVTCYEPTPAKTVSDPDMLF